MSTVLNALKLGVGKDRNRIARENERKAGMQRISDLASTIASIGLTVATAGAGAPALLAKIPGFAKLTKAIPALGKVAKFLDATKKTSRAGVYGTNILNKIINRSIGDLIVPDASREGKDFEKKVTGYLTDTAGEMTNWGKSFMPDSTNPWTGDAWKDITNPTSVSNTPVTTNPSNPTSVSNTPVTDPRPQVNIGGVPFATTPNMTQGLFGNTIKQQPTRYKDGNPYYSLLNMIKD